MTASHSLYEDLLKSPEVAVALKEIFPRLFIKEAVNTLMENNVHGVIEHVYLVFHNVFRDVSKVEFLSSSLLVIKGAKIFRKDIDIYNQMDTYLKMVKNGEEISFLEFW